MLPWDSAVNYSCHVKVESWPSDQFIPWVRQQLRRREWNDAEFARRLNTSSGTVSHWMTGKRQPSTRSCDRIADLFGANLDLVLTLAGHRVPDTPIQPDDPKKRLHDLIDRVRLTPTQSRGLEAMLISWLEPEPNGS